MMSCDFLINVILLYWLISKLKQFFTEIKFQDSSFSNSSKNQEHIKDDYNSDRDDKKFNDDDWSKISMLSSNKLKDIITSHDNRQYYITPYDPTQFNSKNDTTSEEQISGIYHRLYIYTYIYIHIYMYMHCWVYMYALNACVLTWTLCEYQ